MGLGGPNEQPRRTFSQSGRCATVQPLTWNIRATVGPARCNCEHYVQTKPWLAMEAPAGLGRLLWAISCPVVEVLVLVPVGPETKPRLTQSKWNWSARAGECSRYLAAWPFLSHRDKWYHKKSTNKQQIDAKIFTSKHKVMEYIEYARGTVWHLHICHVESEMWPKIKQICLNMKWKIIEMYLSDLPPAPWNKFPIPCS